MADATPVGTGNSKPPISAVLDDLKAAEAKVRDMIKDATAQKERTIADAKREVISIRERYAKEIEEATGKIAREAASKIEADRKKIFENTDARTVKVRSQANSKISQAKDLLVKDLMRTIDDQA